METIKVTDIATKDQVAAVMLQHGTKEQQKEALEYCGVVDTAFENTAEKNQSSFRKKLELLINEHSMENESDTPDFILADYLVDCLKAFDKASRARTNWYMRR